MERIGIRAQIETVRQNFVSKGVEYILFNIYLFVTSCGRVLRCVQQHNKLPQQKPFIAFLVVTFQSKAYDINRKRLNW